jgi:hypothetical protein
LPLAVGRSNLQLPWGYTQGLHQRPLECSKALFYGAFSKPFYYGGEGGIPSPDAADARKPPKNEDSGKVRSSFVTTAVYRRFGPSDCVSAWGLNVIGIGVPSSQFNEINGLKGSHDADEGAFFDQHSHIRSGMP